MQKPRYSQQNYTVSVPTSGQTVQLSWQDDISGNNFIFSGTPLLYAWTFHDKNDHWYTESNQNYTVVDNRFQWQHISQGELQVNWYGQGSDFGQIVLSQALDSIKRISANLGSGPTSPIMLWVYQSSDDFRGALPPNTFEWVGGLAYPPLNEAFIVVNGVNDETLTRDMPHELTHVVFHEIVTLTDLIPTWFDEGLAVYNQIYHEPEMTQRFKNALNTHSLLRFDSLTDGFPSDSDKAYLAYAQSWNFVSYMYNTYGIARMTHFIQLLHTGNGTFEDQMTSAFGQDSAHIENQWLISLNQPPILAPTQPTPQSTHKTSAPVLTTTDPSIPWLIAFGVLLILLSLSGLSLLFIFQIRRNRVAASTISPSMNEVPGRHLLSSQLSPAVSIPATPPPFERFAPSPSHERHTSTAPGETFSTFPSIEEYSSTQPHQSDYIGYSGYTHHTGSQERLQQHTARNAEIELQEHQVPQE